MIHPDSVSDGNSELVVKTVRPSKEENLEACKKNLYVYNNLWDNSIFETAIYEKETETKLIKALIIGDEDICYDMAKNILSLGQMPGYRVSVTFYDTSSNKKELKEDMPGIEQGIWVYKDGFAAYKFDYIYREEMTDEVLKDVTFVFAGYKARKKGKEEKETDYEELYKKADELYNRIKNIRGNEGFIFELYSKQLEERDKLHNSKIICLDSQSYWKDSDNLENNRVVKISKDICKYKYNGKTDEWEKGLLNDYDSCSRFARSLAYRYKYKILKGKKSFQDINDTIKSDEWLKYEHMRWDVFTMTRGYMPTEKCKRDDIRKLHRSLVPFDKLSSGETESDYMELPVDIIKELCK